MNLDSMPKDFLFMNFYFLIKSFFFLKLKKKNC